MRLFLLLLFLPFFGFSQAGHLMSASEKGLMRNYLHSIQRSSTGAITTPPSSPVRASAEWEEIDGLMITWTNYPAILREIVRAAQMETKVYIVCSDSNNVKSALAAAGIADTNLEFVVAPFNSIWCRDYGQWNIYTNDVDSIALVDWVYNRPRPSDDTVPSSIQNYTGLPMYETSIAPYRLIHTGGNFMCDGFGTGFSSKLILNENPNITESDIDTIMKKFMGISRYIKMNTLPYDQIHHIDMHIKLLDEETLLVGEYPQGIADGPQLEANLQYVLANFNSVFGTPYKVIRIPMPPDAQGDYPDNNGDYRTYTNSVFVNKTVILPTYGPQYDTTAIRIYHEALPGYTITGIDCNSIIPSLGAIHCITKEIASADPLLISHQRLSNTMNDSLPYTVNARIQHRSGIQSANVFYRIDTSQTWTSIPMSNSSGYIWTADIPPQPAGSTIYYYIDATSVSGKTQVRPITSPTGYFSFDVLLNTGINKNVNAFSVERAFPNPSHGITCIPVTTENVHLTITLKNVLGENVSTIYDGVSNGDKKYFVNTSGMSSGIYLLEIRTGNDIATQSLVIW